MNEETRSRFLAAIAKQVPADRVIEVHLFGAIRQGGMESGVAVIALERASDSACHPERSEGSASAEAASASENEEDDDASVDDSTAPASRYTVYSARYRYTLKGLDRGKWEVSVTEEADAPLLTVDAVVRGVQRRSGDADEVVRLSGDEFRAALPTAQPVA